MRILGISNAHDANVCVIEDGKVLVHVEKERLTRVRYDVGSMEDFVPGILKSIGLTIDDIDFVATSIPVWKDMPTTGKMVGGEYHHATDWATGEMLLCGRKIPAYNIAHHLGHLAVAYCLSPFDEADILSLDGGGNFTFGLLAKASMGKFDLIKDLNEQNLAWLWNALAGRIFGSMDAVGKVMGLAPYGKPVYVDKLYKHFGHPMDGMTMIKMDEFPDHTKAIPFVEIGTKNGHRSFEYLYPGRCQVGKPLHFGRGCLELCDERSHPENRNVQEYLCAISSQRFWFVDGLWALFVAQYFRKSKRSQTLASLSGHPTWCG
jgi:predicted NodU family carbamoyl transferase